MEREKVITPEGAVAVVTGFEIRDILTNPTPYVTRKMVFGTGMEVYPPNATTTINLADYPEETAVIMPLLEKILIGHLKKVCNPEVSNETVQ